ncbi:amidohydrolase family protein [Candidatus Bathyarchaeota archaeon]|nr:amidohydrolase family protein [Candidatus Bathyarchaeota archaeon]
MNEQGTMIDNGAVAVNDGLIVEIGKTHILEKKFNPEETLDANKKVIMPGLIDTYGHSGHGLIGGFHHPIHGWPAGCLYWHATTDRWWYAEAQLASLERLRFGVTTGASIVGSTPARTDSPIFGIRNAEAYSKVGTKAVLGVGPPDIFIPHIPDWKGSYYENDQWIEREFTYDDALKNSVEVIKKWHLGADNRIRIALAPPYIFGRHTWTRYTHTYLPENIPKMLEKALEIRELADRHGVQIHTHIFGDSIDFAIDKFGLDEVYRILGPDVVIAHGNGLNSSEIKIIADTGASVATAPSTGENIWYGYAPIVELIEAGANVTISTDGSAPRFSFDLFKDISRAMWHQWIRYETQAVLPAGKALRMVTIDAARALGVEDETGSLEAGKKADIILIDMDKPHLTPMTYIPHQLAFYVNGSDVDSTIIDGKVLMENRKVKSVDPNDVMKLAREEAERSFDLLDLDDFKPSDKQFWKGSRYGEE